MTMLGCAGDCPGFWVVATWSLGAISKASLTSPTLSDSRLGIDLRSARDAVSLWKSKPTKTLNDFQTCEVCVQKVKILTLQVHCPDSGDWCRASWVEAILAD
jgi:hypothetical protein